MVQSKNGRPSTRGEWFGVSLFGLLFVLIVCYQINGSAALSLPHKLIVRTLSEPDVRS
jgi:hypothetical protein